MKEKTCYHMTRLIKFKKCIYKKVKGSDKKYSTIISGQHCSKMKVSVPADFQFLDEAVKLDIRIEIQQKFQSFINGLSKELGFNNFKEISVLIEQMVRNMK